MRITTDECHYSGKCDLRIGKKICRALNDTYFPGPCRFRKIDGMPAEKYALRMLREGYSDEAVMQITGFPDYELVRIKHESETGQRSVHA